MAPLLYGSSQSDPRFANYRGGGTSYTSSQTNPYAANYQQRQSINITPRPTPTVLGAQTGSVTGGGGNGNQQLASIGTHTDAINNATDNYNEIIDRDYNTNMENLKLQEEGYHNEFGIAKEIAQTSTNRVKNAAAQQKDTALSGLDYQQSTAQKSASNSIQQSRDLFRQIQQQNIAQLAGSGLSSSSVAEALAENLGVETARRIAGATGTLNEVVQNIAKEKSRVENYYQTKMVEIEEELGNTIKGLQSQLMAGLNQINQARNTAATEKANRRQTLLTQAQTQIANLQAKAQEFTQGLETWKAQNLDKLSAAPDVVQKVYDQISYLQNQPGMQNLVLSPEFSFNNQGQVTGGRINSSKKDEEETGYPSWLNAGTQG